MDVALAAAIVGVNHVALILVSPGTNRHLGDKIIRSHIGCWHQNQLGAFQRQTSGVLRKLNVVADQKAQPPTVQLHNRKAVLAGAEHRLVQVAVQVRLAIVAKGLAVAVDQLHRVVNQVVSAQFRIPIKNRNIVTLGNRRDITRSEAIAGLRQGTRRLGTDVVAGEKHLRANQQLCTECCRLSRLIIQTLQIAADIQRQGRALVQGDVHGSAFCSIGQGDGANLVEHITGTWVVGVGLAAEMGHDAPHRIQ